MKSILVAALFSISAVLFSNDSSAGVVTTDLQDVLSGLQASDDVSIIIYFEDNLNKQAFRDLIADTRGLSAASLSNAQQSADRKERRRLHRKQFIESLKQTAASRQGLTRFILRNYLDSSSRDLWMINGLAVTVPARLVNIVAGLPFVKRVALDRKIVLQESPTANGAVPTWNLEMVKAPDLWNSGFTGSGIVIGSMDTGVDGQHPDLINQWRGGINSWFNPYVADSTLETPHDAIGHGTQTMGVMVGGNASGTVIGVAPDAQWISAKIFQDDRSATLSAIHASFQWMLDPDADPLTDDAPDIVNNSWGILTNIGVCDPEFDDDMDALRVADIAVVFSAGNEGPAANTGTSPATNTQSVSVGSVDEFFNIAFTSSRGPSPCNGNVFPTLTAPGVNIYTTDLSFGLGLLLDPYTGVSGTSLAAPHVSGVMALLKGAVSTSTAVDLESAIVASAVDLDVLGPDDAYGYGLVDAQAALLNLRCPAGSVDTDGDGYYDACDNCIELPNPDQLDSDADGFGNRCDADINNDNITNILDIGLYKSEFDVASAHADINGDGVANILDIGLLKTLLYTAPGPSGLVP